METLLISKERRRIRTEYLRRSRQSLRNGKVESKISPDCTDSVAIANTSIHSDPEIDGDDPDCKRELRRIRNRESALQSRKRKSEEIDMLNKKVGESFFLFSLNGIFNLSKYCLT